MKRAAGEGPSVAAVPSIAGPGGDEPCRDAFGPEAARQVFDRLRAHRGADGCTLTDLRTEQAQMTVRWSKHGEPMPDATLVPAGCASFPTVVGETLALRSPPELAASCPDALSAMIEAVGALHPSTAKLAARPYSPSLPFAVGSWAVLALAFAAALLVVVVALRRGVGSRE